MGHFLTYLCDKIITPYKNLELKTYEAKSIYLLTSSTNAAKGFSHPYIFITRIPEMTSFIVRILSSVKTAVSALKQQTEIA